MGNGKAGKKLKNTRKLEVGRYRANPHRSRHYGSDRKIILPECEGTVTVLSGMLFLSKVQCKKGAGEEKTPVIAGI